VKGLKIRMRKEKRKRKRTGKDEPKDPGLST
jgi:hypothetical protein